MQTQAEQTPYDITIERFNEAIDRRPTFVQGYNYRGIAYCNKGEIDRAIEDFNTAIRRKENYAEAYSNRGAAYRMKGDYDRAFEDCNTAIRLDPNLPEAYNNRGIVYKLIGEIESAINDYNTAIELDPSFAYAYYNRGIIYYEKEEYELATMDYNKAIKLRPDLVDSDNNRGNVYSKKGEYEGETSMNIPSESNTQTDFTAVLAKINEIVESSADDDYIYRGEKEHYKKVCSGLYRVRPNTEGVDFDIKDFQEEVLAAAKNHLGKKYDKEGDLEILTEYQHFGGKTNLIDFTKCHLIALFFACDGSHDKKGRVIFLKKKSNGYKIRDPQKIIDRVNSQKSVFVESSKGYVEPDIEVTIPANLKKDMLYYLKKYHDISVESIYNDMHGFIRRSAYGEHLNGLGAQRDAYEAKTRGDKDRYHKKAIGHYTKAIELYPKFVKAYNNRAVSYRSVGDRDAAIRDCNEAIKLNPKLVSAHTIRGLIYSDKGEFDMAIQKYDEAIALKPDYAVAYNNRGIALAAQGKIDAAIKDFEKAIALNSEYANPYNNRGTANVNKNDFDAALRDYSKAIALNSEYAKAYYNRGLLRLLLRDWEKAKEDLTTAKDLGADIVALFHNVYKTVENFEAEYKKYDVKLPEDIAALLSQY